MRPWVLPTIIGLLATALVATSAVGLVQSARLADERARTDELRTEVADLRAQVADLEQELDETGDPLGGLLGGDAAGLLDGLLGEDAGALGGLLDGLLGGEGGALDLDAVPGSACLAPDPGGGGLLDGGLDGLLGDAFGGGSGEPVDPDTLVATTAAEVAALRELSWSQDVEVDFLDDAALRARLDEVLSEDLDEAVLDLDQRLLVALGAIPPDVDLLTLQTDLLDEQVAGFYDPETGELVVRLTGDGELGPADRITLAHELDHALTDQALGLPDLAAPTYRDDPDRALGALGLVEGDATLLMQRWALDHLSLADQLGMALDPAVAASQASLDAFPDYLGRELLFPYTAGLDWACDQYLEGGWAAIDAAYDDPPTTSAEILWGTPLDPAPTATVGTPPGYELGVEQSFGAAPLLWLFEAPGGDGARALDDADGRARAWAGGTTSVFTRGDDTAVGLSLVDGGTGSEPLCDSVAAWLAAADPSADTDVAEGATVIVGADRTAVVRCAADDVVVGIGPDLVTATAVAAG